MVLLVSVGGVGGVYVGFWWGFTLFFVAFFIRVWGVSLVSVGLVAARGQVRAPSTTCSRRMLGPPSHRQHHGNEIDTSQIFTHSSTLARHCQDPQDSTRPYPRVGVVLTLTQRHHLARGHRTGTNHCGVGE